MNNCIIDNVEMIEWKMLCTFIRPNQEQLRKTTLQVPGRNLTCVPAIHLCEMPTKHLILSTLFALILHLIYALFKSVLGIMMAHCCEEKVGTGGKLEICVVARC